MRNRPADGLKPMEIAAAGTHEGGLEGPDDHSCGCGDKVKRPRFRIRITKSEKTEDEGPLSELTLKYIEKMIKQTLKAALKS